MDEFFAEDQKYLPQNWKMAVIGAILMGGLPSELEIAFHFALPASLARWKYASSGTVCIYTGRSSLSRAPFKVDSWEILYPTNFLCFTDKANCMPDIVTPIEVCLLDFSKAFESINHHLLPMKF